MKGLDKFKKKEIKNVNQVMGGDRRKGYKEKSGTLTIVIYSSESDGGY